MQEKRNQRQEHAQTTFERKSDVFEELVAEELVVIVRSVTLNEIWNMRQTRLKQGFTLTYNQEKMTLRKNPKHKLFEFRKGRLFQLESVLI